MTVKYHYNQFPPHLEEDKKLTNLVAEARTELGRYDGFLISMSNQDVLLSPLFTQEAVLSSRIEGTQSSLSEVLAFEAEQDLKNTPQQKQDEMIEILNYRHAMFQAKDNLQKIPLSQRIVKQAHQTLMDQARGQNKNPGNYRKTPVWIGGTTLETARFVPIEAQYIQEAMGNWEKFMHDNTTYDPLIKAALIHVEFEAIHPFLDGNGRLGRMIIPLYLWCVGILSNPSFYMSEYIDKNRDAYYELLLNVSSKNQWKEWCIFFIEGILEQAKNNCMRAQKIVSFYNKLKSEIPSISRSPHGITALDYIYKHTYFNSSQFYKSSGVPRTIAKSLLDKFEEHGILLCKKGKGRTPNFYIFKDLIDIADGK